MHIASGHRPSAGFTLVEVMISLAIALILSIGIVSLFGASSRSNQHQDALARVQENGRYAALRLEDDLRMQGAQYCSNRTGNRFPSALVPLWQDRAPTVFAANLALPDTGATSMASIDSGGNMTTADATASYGLSTRFFIQGHNCVGATCTPNVPGGLPTADLADGSRVPDSDVLTVRYLRGTGWPIDGVGNCVTGGSLTLAPQTGDDAINFVAATPQLALISDCQTPSIVPIANVAGNVLTLGTVLPGGFPVCAADGARDVRVFNFTRDFITVTYYLAFRTNDDPDATPNAGGLTLTPVLIRRENGVEQELIRGVDRLDFVFGVLDNGGSMRFLNAEQVETRNGSTINCPPKPARVSPSPDIPTVGEPGCLWRSVRRIEASILVNSVDELATLDAIGRSYRYQSSSYSPTATAALPSGILVGNFLRREFIAQSTGRNKMP
jgi:type IV pilus assembly protein PilW